MLRVNPVSAQVGCREFPVLFAQMDRCWADICACFRKMELMDAVRRRSSGECYTLATLSLPELSLHWFDQCWSRSARFMKILQVIASHNVSMCLPAVAGIFWG